MSLEQMIKKIIGHKPFWGKGLNNYVGLSDAVIHELRVMINHEVRI
ncbi:hypothetical protein [Scopulibacillus cellulosilyticus]